MAENTNDHRLHPKVVELARGKNFAALTTLLPDGHPQTQVMWVDADDDNLLRQGAISQGSIPFSSGCSLPLPIFVRQPL